MSSKRVSLDRTLVVGVDVAAEQHVAFIRGPRGLEVGPFAFSNDRSGFGQLASAVAAPQAATGPFEVVFVDLPLCDFYD